MSIKVEVPIGVLFGVLVIFPSCGDGDSPVTDPDRPSAGGRADDGATAASGGPQGIVTLWHDEDGGIKQSEGALDDGRKVGDWTWWHPNGQVAVRGAFQIIVVDGVESSEEVGEWIDWHPNGQTKSKRTWVDGRVEGEVTVWHDNGKEARRAVYAAGRAHGSSISFHPGGGVSKEEEFLGGRLNGPYKTYWPTGEMKVVGEWASGVQVGNWSSWHPNGNKQSDETFEAGALVGTVKTWFASGAKESESEWVSGSVVSGRQWYESGMLRQAGASRDGLLEAWYEGGQLIMTGNLSEGQRTGAWQFFNEDGSLDLEMTGVYEDGQKKTGL